MGPGSEQAQEVITPIFELLRHVRGADFPAQREKILEMLAHVEGHLSYLFGQHELAKGRISQLEAELKLTQADQGSAVLSQLEGFMRASAEAIGEHRRRAIHERRARVMLDDRSVAVIIDSLDAMRERLEGEGIEPVDTARALRLIGRVVDPATSVVDIETRRVPQPEPVQGTA